MKLKTVPAVKPAHKKISLGHIFSPKNTVPAVVALIATPPVAFALIWYLAFPYSNPLPGNGENSYRQVLEFNPVWFWGVLVVSLALLALSVIVLVKNIEGGTLVMFSFFSLIITFGAFAFVGMSTHYSTPSISQFEETAGAATVEHSFHAESVSTLADPNKPPFPIFEYTKSGELKASTIAYSYIKHSDGTKKGNN